MPKKLRIVERLNDPAPIFSFELFPPKSSEGEVKLLTTVRELADLVPDFVSVTYGAGGSTRERTLSIATRIEAETGVPVMVHLACRGHSPDELKAILDQLAKAGIENVLALRGDGPAIGVPGEFHFASELVRLIKQEGYPFCVGAAAYPEGHLEAADRDRDLAHLRAKVEQGAEFLITQLFYDNAFFFDFVQRAHRARIRAPIIGGIMPLTSFEQISRITRMCGATVPMRLQLQMEKLKDDPEAMSQLGIANATLQCQDLLRRGVPGIHFYTLNKSRGAQIILSALRNQGTGGV
jgi:methylenetetrahydrofolate reductase (NADPH)